MINTSSYLGANLCPPWTPPLAATERPEGEVHACDQLSGAFQTLMPDAFSPHVGPDLRLSGACLCACQRLF